MKTIKKILVGMLAFCFAFLLCSTKANAYDDSVFIFGPEKYVTSIDHPVLSKTYEASIISKLHNANDPVQDILDVKIEYRSNDYFEIVNQSFDKIDNYQAKLKFKTKVKKSDASFDEEVGFIVKIKIKNKEGNEELIEYRTTIRVIFNRDTRTTQSNDNEPFELSPSRHTIEFINNKQVKVFVNKKQGATVDSVEQVGFQTIANDPNVDITQGTYTSTGNGNGYMTFSVTNKNVDEAWEETRNLTIQITYKVGGVEYTCNLPYELILRYNKDGALDQDDDDADDDDDDGGEEVTLYGDPDDLARILDVESGVGKVVYDFALLIAAILTFLGVMWVGVNIVMARANGEQRSSSMQGLMYIVIGIIILDIVLVLYGLLSGLVGDPESEVEQLDVTVVSGEQD